MKQPIIAAFFSLTLLSCGKNDDKIGSPAGPKVSNLSATINGRKVSSAIVNFTKQPNLAIIGLRSSPGSFEIGISAVPYFGTGTYPLDSITAYVVDANNMGYRANAGVLTISKVSPDTIKGEFLFTAIKGSTTINVEDGKFTLYP